MAVHRRQTRLMRWQVATGVIAAAAVLATGCTAGSSASVAGSGHTGNSATGSGSIGATVSGSASADTCPPPATLTTPPTDFPQPVLVKRSPSAPESAADTALAQQGLAATGLAGPISRGAFEHYLGATGSYLPLPIDDLLAQRSDLVSRLSAELVAAADASALALQQRTLTRCDTRPFESVWTTYGDQVRDDWYYTLGSFAYKVVGSISPANPKATGVSSNDPLLVTFSAAIGDTYNFDPGTAFAGFEQLALDGYAADFLDGGLTTPRTVAIPNAGQIGTLSFESS